MAMPRSQKLIVSGNMLFDFFVQLEQFSSSYMGSSATEAAWSPSQLHLITSTSVSEQQSFMESDFAMDFSGTLFSTFNQMFPDPKEMCN